MDQTCKREIERTNPYVIVTRTDQSATFVEKRYLRLQTDYPLYETTYFQIPLLDPPFEFVDEVFGKLLLLFHPVREKLDPRFGRLAYLLLRIGKKPNVTRMERSYGVWRALSSSAYLDSLLGDFQLRLDEHKVLLQLHRPAKWPKNGVTIDDDPKSHGPLNVMVYTGLAKK